MDETTESVAAAWLPDPTKRHEVRYWNGSSWTEHVSDAGVQATDPPGDLAPPSAHAVEAASGGWKDRMKTAAQKGQDLATTAKGRYDERQAEAGDARAWAPGSLWEGERRTVTAAATGGKMVRARYRITAEYLYFEAGLIGSSSEQVPMWAVRDVDVKQSMTQKARGVGDVVVRVQHDDYTGRPQVVLESIEDPRKVRDLINQHAHRAHAAPAARPDHLLPGQSAAAGAPAGSGSNSGVAT